MALVIKVCTVDLKRFYAAPRSTPAFAFDCFRVHAMRRCSSPPSLLLFQEFLEGDHRRRASRRPARGHCPADQPVGRPATGTSVTGNYTRLRLRGLHLARGSWLEKSEPQGSVVPAAVASARPSPPRGPALWREVFAATCPARAGGHKTALCIPAEGVKPSKSLRLVG